MKVINPSFELLSMPSGESILKLIELAGRTCYKSENSITQNSAEKFVTMIVRSGHHSVIEHCSITVKIICDRGVSHEIVRHRLASFSQESTRYANYSKAKFNNEITVIKPCFWQDGSSEYLLWYNAMLSAEKCYMDLLKKGAQPEQARSVLPNSLKTEIVVTCNVREWRHILSLRCSNRSHPQMREIMLPILFEFHEKIPVIFDDIFTQFENEYHG